MKDELAGHTERGWDDNRKGYACLDSVPILVPRRTASPRDPDEPRSVPSSGVRYARLRRVNELVVRITVSGVEFARDMAVLLGGSEGIRTTIFPGTVRKIRDKSFADVVSLRSAVLNEGLEALGSGRYYDNYSGVFQDSGLEEVTLPKSLKEVSLCTFFGCARLRTVRVEEGSTADIARIEVPEFASIGPSGKAIVGGVGVWSLRELRDVAIPEGAERIGSRWFWGSGIESVEVPVSVVEIGVCAFRNCRELKRLVFRGTTAAGTDTYSTSPQKNSRLRRICADAFRGCGSLRDVGLPDCLEEIGSCAFRDSGLERFSAPGALRTIRHGAFSRCRGLKLVALNEGLEVLGGELRDNGLMYGVFEESGVERVALPSTLRRIGYFAFDGCRGLKSIDLPGRLEHIGRRSFFGSGLQSATLPGSLRTVS